jgi:hypothetical protein
VLVFFFFNLTRPAPGGAGLVKLKWAF